MVKFIASMNNFSTGDETVAIGRVQKIDLQIDGFAKLTREDSLVLEFDRVIVSTASDFLWFT